MLSNMFRISNEVYELCILKTIMNYWILCLLFFCIRSCDNHNTLLLFEKSDTGDARRFDASLRSRWKKSSALELIKLFIMVLIMHIIISSLTIVALIFIQKTKSDIIVYPINSNQVNNNSWRKKIRQTKQFYTRILHFIR